MMEFFFSLFTYSEYASMRDTYLQIWMAEWSVSRSIVGSTVWHREWDKDAVGPRLEFPNSLICLEKKDVKEK